MPGVRLPAGCAVSSLNSRPAPLAPGQVTKVPRAAGAVLLAPLVGRLMDWLQQRLGLKTRRAVRQRCGRPWMQARKCRRRLAAEQAAVGSSGAPCCLLQVFGVFVAGCVALALALFGATVLAWA